MKIILILLAVFVALGVLLIPSQEPVSIVTVEPTRTMTHTPRPRPSLTPSPTPSATPTPVIVAATGLRVRVGPGIVWDIVGYLNAGDVVQVLGCRDGWAKIADGWVNGGYLDSVQCR